VESFGPGFDWHPLRLSLFLACAAVLLAAPLGILLARLMSGRHFWGKEALEGLFLLPLVLPPVMTGLALLLLLGRHGPLSRLHLLFTPSAAVLAAAVVAFPLTYQSARSAFNSIDHNLEDVAHSLGASAPRVFWTVTAPLAWPGLAGGAVLAFARALGEFGATVMVAGNLPGKTLTAPVAIYLATEDGNLRLAGQYALALGTLNLLFMALLNGYLRRRGWLK
jgi:molybdate transport system permease protein